MCTYTHTCTDRHIHIHKITELVDRTLTFTKKNTRVLNSSSLDIKVKGNSKQHVLYNFFFAYTYNTHLQTQNKFFFFFLHFLNVFCYGTDFWIRNMNWSSKKKKSLLAICLNNIVRTEICYFSRPPVFKVMNVILTM